MKKIFILLILSIGLFTGCGIVSRTITPNRIMTTTYDCSRDINVFAPNGYKIYYSFNGGEEIFDGTSNGNKHTIHIHEKYVAQKVISNWSLWTTNDVANVIVQLGYECRRTGYTTMSVIIKDKNGYYYHNEDFNLWGWYSDGSMPYNTIQEFPEVKSFSLSTPENGASSFNSTCIIEYNNKSLEIQ